jgi:hypothetical protein
MVALDVQLATDVQLVTDVQAVMTVIPVRLVHQNAMVATDVQVATDVLANVKHAQVVHLAQLVTDVHLEQHLLARSVQEDVQMVLAAIALEELLVVVGSW